MLTVGGGDGVTVDPKRGTREGFGAGLGFTARLWLRQWDWNAGATGGGDCTLAVGGGGGASVRSTGGTGKSDGARLGSRARRWLCC